MISDICYILEEYIDKDLAKNVFSEFAGYSTSSILSYMMQVIEFFKSYKVVFNEKGEVINVGNGGVKTINEDSVIMIYDQTWIKNHTDTKEYINMQEELKTKNTSVYTDDEENEQGNRWFREYCQIITHHDDGTEEIDDVQ